MEIFWSLLVGPLCHVRNKIVYGPQHRTVYTLMGVVCWWLFPSLLCNSEINTKIALSQLIFNRPFSNLTATWLNSISVSCIHSIPIAWLTSIWKVNQHVFTSSQQKVGKQTMTIDKTFSLVIQRQEQSFWNVPSICLWGLDNHTLLCVFHIYIRMDLGENAICHHLGVFKFTTSSGASGS